MLQTWLAGLKSGTPSVSYECLMANSLATILAVESMTTGMPVKVDLSVLG